MSRSRFAVYLSAALAETRLRLMNLSRYPGLIALETLVPIVYAAMPILLGRAVAGGRAAANFQLHTGTTQYVQYLLIGSNVFIIVTRSLWDLAYWLRFEQETGTLEAIYLTPIPTLVLASGVSLFSFIRSLATGAAAYLLGCLVFRVPPFAGGALPLAAAFVLVGLIPVAATSFLFGALVLKVKESNSLINLMQWGVSLLMGVYFPVAALPPLLRGAALLFPPTWMVQGARSALLGVGYFFGTWYRDMAVLWAFLLLMPLLAIQVFRRVENGARANRGIGEF